MSKQKQPSSQAANNNTMPAHAFLSLSHAPLPLPLPWPAEEGRGGGDQTMSNQIYLSIPLPPLLSWSWHGERQWGMRGKWRGRDIGQSSLCLCWLLFVGCSLLAAHVISAYYLKWCTPWVKASRSVSLRESFCTLWGGKPIIRCEQLRTRKLAQQTVLYSYFYWMLSATSKQKIYLKVIFTAILNRHTVCEHTINFNFT